MVKSRGRIAVFGSSIIGRSIIGRSFPAHLAIILGCHVDMFVIGGLDSEETLRMLDLFREKSYGLVILAGPMDVDLYIQGKPWEEIVNRAERIYRGLKETGAVIVTYSPLPWLQDKYEKLCKEEEVIFVRDIVTDFWGKPEYMEDEHHPNDVGYNIMAQRVAKAIVDEGLVEIPRMFPTEKDLPGSGRGERGVLDG